MTFTRVCDFLTPPPLCPQNLFVRKFCVFLDTPPLFVRMSYMEAPWVGELQVWLSYRSLNGSIRFPLDAEKFGNVLVER